MRLAPAFPELVEVPTGWESARPCSTAHLTKSRINQHCLLGQP